MFDPLLMIFCICNVLRFKVNYSVFNRPFYRIKLGLVDSNSISITLYNSYMRFNYSVGNILEEQIVRIVLGKGKNNIVCLKDLF